MESRLSMIDLSPSLRLRIAALALAVLPFQPQILSAQPAGAPRLPEGYKTELASWLVSDYVKDAVGPATVSEAENHQGLFGSSASVMVRYPVKDPSFFAPPNSTVSRCITVSVTDASGNVKATRSRSDGENCSGYRSARPYQELIRMGAKLEACRKKGPGNCLLSTTMPEAQARKLMNAK